MVAIAKILLCVVATAACTKQTGSEGTAALLATLKELQDEMSASRRDAGETAEWCRGASHDRTSMIGSINRQLQESQVAMQQILSVQQQLEDQLQLTHNAREEKSMRLADTLATSQLAEDDSAAEQQQLDSATAATKDALQLVHQQMRQGGVKVAQTVTQFMQATADQLTDDEKSVMSSLADGDPVSSKPQALLQALNDLSSRLVGESQAAKTDHKIMQQKVFAFTDHLNATVMELQSEAAALNLEKAHRSRERALLQSKMSELTALQKVAKVSKNAAGSMCKLQAQRAVEASDMMSEELKAVRALLAQMPSGSDLLGVPDATAPASFLQVRRSESPLAVAAGDLKHMAQQFPDEAAWFVASARGLDSGDAVSLAEVSHSHVHKPRKHAAPLIAKKHKKHPAQEDALSAIKAFAGDEAESTDAVGNAVTESTARSIEALKAPKQVKEAYRKLADHLKSKDKLVGSMEKWCTSVSRDAKSDDDATGRALARTAAKLDLAKVSTLESERDAGFYQEQNELYMKSLSWLNALTENDAEEFARTDADLKDVSSKLLSLASGLGGDDNSADEKKAADMVRTLVDQLEQHIDKVQEWHQGFRKAVSEVTEADHTVEEALVEDARRNQRRLVRFKSEARLLSSVSAAKRFDHSMSSKYNQLSQRLCSADQVQALGDKDRQIHRELSALQSSLMDDQA